MVADITAVSTVVRLRHALTWSHYNALIETGLAVVLMVGMLVMVRMRVMMMMIEMRSSSLLIDKLRG